jgi:Fe-S-cluster containining protein
VGEKDVEKGDGQQGIAVDFATPHGPLRAMLTIPPKPLRLPELAFNFMGMSDKLTDLAVAHEEREGRSVSCRKGCGACCRQLVPLSPPEAWMLADIVAGMAPARQTEVRAAFATADDAVARSGLGAALAGRIETMGQMTSLALQYFGLGVACPFLRDESCSIHPYRPSICREYLVTSPAENCAQLGRGPVERVPVGMRLSRALSHLTAKLLGKEAEVVPLTHALAWAAAHREDGQRTWDARTLIEGLLAEFAAR